jgi:hypothetical protein
MSSVDQNASAIDQKKNQNSEDANTNTNSASTIFRYLIVLGLILIVGPLTLYSCRASQANLLPTKLECEPYADTKLEFGEEEIFETNVNIVDEKGSRLSTKMYFFIKENMDMMNGKKTVDGAEVKSSSFLSYLKNLTNGKSTTGRYFGSILQNILWLNFFILNSVYQLCNNLLSETAIIILGPIILFFVLFLLLPFVSWFYGIYLLFSKLLVIFETRDDDGKWKRVEPLFSMSNASKFALFFLFFFLNIFAFFFGILGALAGIFCLVAVIYAFILPFFFKTEIGENKDDEKKPYGPWFLIKDVLKFKRNVIMWIATFLLLMHASSAHGFPGVWAVIIGCFLLSFYGIYKKYTPGPDDTMSPMNLNSFEPNTKECPSDTNSSKPLPIVASLKDLTNEQTTVPSQKQKQTPEFTPAPLSIAQQKIFKESLPPAQKPVQVVAPVPALASTQTLVPGPALASTTPRFRASKLQQRPQANSSQASRRARGLMPQNANPSPLGGGGWKTRSNHKI